MAFLPVTETCSAGAYARLAHAEIDGLLAEGATPIVVGGTGLYLRAALADLALRPPPRPGVRERLDRGDAGRRAARRCTRDCARAAGRGRAHRSPTDRTRVIRALELHEQGVAHDDGGELWTHGDPPPDAPRSASRWTARRLRAAHRRAGRRDGRGGRRRRRSARADAAGASATARTALGFAELLAGDVDAMSTRTRRYAKRQLTWMRKLPGAELVDVTGRDPADVAAALLP